MLLSDKQTGRKATPFKFLYNWWEYSYYNGFFWTHEFLLTLFVTLLYPLSCSNISPLQTAIQLQQNWQEYSELHLRFFRTHEWCTFFLFLLSSILFVLSCSKIYFRAYMKWSSSGGELESLWTKFRELNSIISINTMCAYHCLVSICSVCTRLYDFNMHCRYIYVWFQYALCVHL